MNIKLLKPIIIALGFITLSASSLFGQSNTTSALSGIVSGSSGIAVSGTTITATHTPTGTVYRAISRSGGVYGITGMRPGGPYVVSVRGAGIQATTVNDVFLQLAVTRPLNIQAQANVVELEAFVVAASEVSSLAPDQIGARSVLDNVSVNSLPQNQSSLNDFARFNPFFTVNEGDRNELTVAGQNSRFNTIVIDGIRVNDQFGLDSAGSVSLVSPVPLDAIEQVSVEVSPYDLRQAGFTGGAINVVTKSGTNDLSGSIYTRYTDDQYRGSDVRNGRNGLFREFTMGYSLGGAIIQDKLFFFVNYEEFTRTQAPSEPGIDPDLGAVQQVIDYGNNVLGVDFGAYAPPTTTKFETEALLINIDWNITDMHRARFSYRGQDGTGPNFGNFDDFLETALDSNFYTQVRDEDYYVVQFFSDWTDRFSTEFKVAIGEYRQPTTFDSALPQIEIDRFPGADGSADAGELFFGTERFRHANNLEYDIFQIFGTGTYYAGDHEISFGFDYEVTEFRNLFLSDSFGNFTFRTLDDFLNDRPQFNGFRNTGINGQNPVAEPEIGVLGIFIQDRWQVNEDLLITGGLRMDTTLSDTQPPAALGFEEAFGFPNNGSIDGESLISPRVGFKYNVKQDWIPEDHNVVLRGGVGLFQGRTPAVWFSNAFTNNGETSGQVSLGSSLRDYLANDFDPNDSPIFVDRQESIPSVDVLTDGVKLPSVWRGNIAVDWEVPAWDLIFTAEILVTETNEALYVFDANQRVIGQAPDGRDIYEDRGVTDQYQEVYVLDNTSEGSAMNYVLSVTKPDDGDGFFGSLSVNFGEAEDVNPFTSSRAVSNWGNRAGFNFNQPELSTSNSEVQERWLMLLGYTHNWGGGWLSRINLVYEGRTGRPFSYVFANDVNGDTRDGNDLLYIPTGPDDAIVDFDPGFDTGAFFDFLDRTGLSQHAGGIAPRNSHDNPWVHRWDLKLTQDVPLKFMGSNLELFVTIRNLGNMLNEDWGLTEEVGFPFTADVVTLDVVNGVPTYKDFDPDEPSVRVGRIRSRWNVLFGAKIEF